MSAELLLFGEPGQADRCCSRRPERTGSALGRSDHVQRSERAAVPSSRLSLSPHHPPPLSQWPLTPAAELLPSGSGASLSSLPRNRCSRTSLDLNSGSALTVNLGQVPTSSASVSSSVEGVVAKIGRVNEQQPLGTGPGRQQGLESAGTPPSSAGLATATATATFCHRGAG